MTLLYSTTIIHNTQLMYMLIIFLDSPPVLQYSYIGGYAYTRTHSYRWVPSNEVVSLGQPLWASGEPTHTSEQCMAYVLDAQGHLKGWVDIAGFHQLLFTCETP